MRVDVILHPALLPPWREGERSLFVVVDVLRTSTTVVTALARGARAFVPFETPDEVRLFAEQSSEPVLVAGEQGGRPIAGFDLENSPSEYTADRVAGRVVAFVSTNGAPLVRRLPDGEAPRTVLLGLVNRAAVVEYCHRWEPEQVWVCCAGQSGAVAYEDVLGAGAFIAGLHELHSVAVTDAAHIALAVYREAAAAPLAAVLRASRHARFLAVQGKQRDLEDAVQVDVYDIVPRWRSGRIVAERPEMAELAAVTSSECAA